MFPFYRFSEQRYWIGEPQLVGIAPVESVQRFFGQDALKKAFGGWVVYSDRTGAQFIGVWGETRVRALTAALERMGADSRSRSTARRERSCGSARASHVA